MNNTYEVCNLQYDNELNTRINNRTFPSKHLQPNFDFRPTSTKYQKFPVHDTTIYDNLKQTYSYDPHKLFYSGTSKAPIHYALNNDDVESKLRNQFFVYKMTKRNTYLNYHPLYITCNQIFTRNHLK